MKNNNYSFDTEVMIQSFLENDDLKIHEFRCADGGDEFVLHDWTPGYLSEICLWAENGRISLLTLEKPKNKYAAAEIIRDSINLWKSGQIRCSDCASVIKKSEIAGHYFAGCYCKNCWDGKWKEIEAKETYN